MWYILQLGNFNPRYVPHIDDCWLQPVHLVRRPTGQLDSRVMGGQRGGSGISMLLPHEALNMDQLGLYVTLHGNPGMTNHFVGVTIDYAFWVKRRSVFGHGLCRILTPSGKNTVFCRLFACLLALPHQYHEAIGEFNQTHPDSPFVPQNGPEFSI